MTQFHNDKTPIVLQNGFTTTVEAFVTGTYSYSYDDRFLELGITAVYVLFWFLLFLAGAVWVRHVK